MLFLAFGLLQSGVLLGVDFGKTGQLLAQAAQFLFEVVAAAALSLEGFAEAVRAREVGGFSGFAGNRISAATAVIRSRFQIAGVCLAQLQQVVAVSGAAARAGAAGGGGA